MATQKLLPPSIESKLPAQKGDTLSIPFLHNRAVGQGQYNRMVLKIKTISTNQEIAIINSEEKYDNLFKIDKDKLIIGQYYKAQLAYKNTEDIIGYYSTVGIFKYTAQPNVCIKSNQNTELQVGKRNYISSLIYGYYSNPDDLTEKVYSYTFNVYKDNELLTTTGELIHNNSNDTENESIDVYNFDYIINPLSTYTLEYKVFTANNLEVSSPLYHIDKGAEVPNSIDYKLFAISDNEIGGIRLRMLCDADIQGKFRLLRLNGEKQEIIRDFVINDIIDGYYDLGIDYTVEQGAKYIYGIQQYNDDFMTELVTSEKVSVDFEDAFLFDGERQLKIKFNPKIASFKDTILESKLDTIGGRYPFIFRNGRTKYKEFSISGLISYWMDNEELFMPRDNEYTTNLTGDNVAVERQFKLEVLEWLNNGQPKLFRSPTEGNYIVRLMNVSLSPDETLGRMLHTFNCTAYEIADYDYLNLKEYGFLINEDSNIPLWRFYTFDDFPSFFAHHDVPSAVWARIYGPEGTIYMLAFENEANGVQIQIGSTGVYELSNLAKPLCDIMLLSFPIDNEIYKIEYATTEANTDTILYNTKKINAINVNEYGISIDSTYTQDVLSNITNQNIVLDNILYLSLQYIGEDKGNSKIQYSYVDDEEEYEITLGRNRIISEQDNWSRVVAGRLELTVNDFDGKFLLDKLVIGPNIRLDMYYRVKEIEVKL